MPPRPSAGLLVYRRGAHGVEVLLVHPGGPYWARRDAGAWTIPKGVIEPGEEPLQAGRLRLVDQDQGAIHAVCGLTDGPKGIGPRRGS